jgi:amidase
LADVVDIRALLGERRASSRELVESCLEQIARLDGGVGAFRVVTAERALREADEADRALRDGDERLLLGVPVAVKDVVDMAGETTAWGTGAVERRAGADGEIVRRLRAAGAVVLGKTSLSELQIWALTATRNPWNLERSAGGTSGGSAAAVAAGMVPLAHGVDGGGSIRLPAAWCGLVGFKPGRDDRAPLSPANWHGLAVHGPLARSVRDAALAAAILRGDRCPQDSALVAATRRSPARLRIAVTVSPPGPAPLDAAPREAVLATGRLLERLGHAVSERPVFGSWPDAQRVAWAVLARFLHACGAQAAALDHPERLDARTRAVARLGRRVPARAVSAALRAEARERRRLAVALRDVDVVVMPVSAREAPPADDWNGLGALRAFIRQSRLIPFTPPWNLVGWPALSVPAGADSAGVPVGVQLVSPPAMEPALLALAAQLEEARPWPRLAPGVG